MKKLSSVLFLFAFFATTLSSLGEVNHLVISQVYGGGGNSGGAYANDFIELYNPSSGQLSTSGLYVQYASTTGNFSDSASAGNNAALPAVTIPAGQYFLIEAAPGSNTSETALPTPDLEATSITISGTAGKVVLTNTLISGSGCPLPSPSVVDLIGWGTANCSEGGAPAAATTNSTSIIRNDPTVDTDNNGNDFSAGTPNPHNLGGGTPPPPTTLAISLIQGHKSKTAMVLSPYVGQKVTVEGVVTAILPTAFYIQSVTDDDDPTTPEGIEIYTKPSASITIGALVSVTGTVATFPNATTTPPQTHIPATEITSPTVSVNGTAPLPAPVTLTASDLSPTGTIYQLTPYEGMRVTFGSLTATSGTDGSLKESTETYSSYGEFYAVVTGTPRPFREPGIDLRDPVVDATKTPAVFDDNPERLYVDSGYLVGSTPIDLSTGAVLPNITGVLDFTNTYDDDYNPPRFFPDPSYSASSITPGMTVQPVAPPAPGEFTVASFNIERFYNTESADDLYYVPAGVNGYNGSSGTPTVSDGQTFQSEAVDVTSTAYANRLKKISLAVRTVLNSPDVVTIEEVENQSVATDIATQINTDAGVDNLYTGYSTDNTNTFTQDGTGISVGFLVKNTVTVNNVTQFGQATPGAPDLADQTFTPTSGNLTTLNDRPWLVLDAGIKRTGGSDYPVTIIANHMKALTGVNSPTNNSTRLKKELQAEDIAKYIQTLQAAGKHVISGGDFNAFEFSDGYTDTLATYTNTNVLPAAQVVQPGVSGLVTPPLTDMALTLPADQRWSYVESGSAQILDHMVVTPELAGGHIAYAHIDADFPVIAYNDPTTPARSSDHDPVIGYFPLPALTPTLVLTPASQDFGSSTVGTAGASKIFTLSNTGTDAASITDISAGGDFSTSNACGSSLDAGANCTINVFFTPNSAGTRTGTLTVTTATGSFTSSLTGTGVAVAPPVPPTLSPTSLTFAATAIGSTTAAQTITVTNSSTVAVTVSSTATTGDYSQKNNCSTLAAGQTCTVSVSFTPTATGSRTGTLTVTTSAGVLTASLTGTGQTPEFTISGPSGSTITQTVAAGSSTSIVLTFTPVAGQSTITLACSGPSPAPTGVTCTVPTSAFTLSGSPVTQTVTIQTTSRVATSGLAPLSWPRSPWTVSLVGLSGVMMFLAARSRRLGQYTVRVAGLLALLLIVCIPAIGCGDSSSKPTGTTNPNGTPAGTYNYTVTAKASDGVTHTQNITLTVQ
ncbi:MAG TPA: choice-of-anchor D domain-containing protein [Granulicella sp.]